MIRRRDLGLPAGRLGRRGEGGIGGWGAPREAILEALWRAMRGREPLSGDLVPPVGDGDGAIEMGVEVDAESGVAPAAGAGSELEETPIELDGVIVLDRAPVLEATDRVEIGARGGGPPGRRGMRGGLGEARIVAREKPGEHAGGLRERAGVGEAEFDHKAILEGAEEALNPTLRLWRVGPDPLDPQLAECPTDLGLARDATELLVDRERGAGVRAKDAVAIGVDGRRETIATEELAEQEEVAVRIFLEAEDGAQHTACGVIDGGEKDEAGAAVLEPGMLTAIELDEETRLRHPLPAPAMAWRATGAGAADARRAEQAVDRGAGEADAFALGQELRKMAIIAAPVAGTGQGEHPRTECLRDVSGGRAAAVAMGQGRQALLTESGEQSADVAERESQQRRRRSGGEAPRLNPWQDLSPLLFLAVQGDCLPGHSPRVTESLNSYGVTDSLNNHSNGKNSVIDQ